MPTTEQGKPLREMQADPLPFVEWFAEEARRPYGDDVIPRHRQAHRGDQAAHWGSGCNYALNFLTL